MATIRQFGKLESARTHEEARQVVCCACFRKVIKNKSGSTVKVVSERLASLVKQFVNSENSVENTSCPTAMCIPAMALCAMEKVIVNLVFAFK